LLMLREIKGLADIIYIGTDCVSATCGA
jgi:hypothetical protein